VPTDIVKGEEDSGISYVVTEEELSELADSIAKLGFAVQVRRIVVEGGVTIPRGNRDNMRFDKGGSMFELLTCIDPTKPGSATAIEKAYTMAHKFVDGHIREQIKRDRLIE
jgi:hypothetical protein